MMTIDEAVIAYCNTVDSVTAIVGNRIYGSRRPQGARPLPEILWTEVTEQRQQKFCGQDLLVSSQWQVDVFGDGKTQVAQCARALSKALRNFSGVMGDVPVGPVFLLNQSDSGDPEPGTIRKILTFNVWYQEEA